MLFPVISFCLILYRSYFNVKIVKIPLSLKLFRIFMISSFEAHRKISKIRRKVYKHRFKIISSPRYINNVKLFTTHKVSNIITFWYSENLPVSCRAAFTAFRCKSDAMSTKKSNERAKNMIHVDRVLHCLLLWSCGRMVSSRVVKTYFRQFSGTRKRTRGLRITKDTIHPARNYRFFVTMWDRFPVIGIIGPFSSYSSIYSLSPFSLLFLFPFLQHTASLKLICVLSPLFLFTTPFSNCVPFSA